MNLQSIEINAVEWKEGYIKSVFFSAHIILNGGLDDEKTYTVPTTYGRCGAYIDKSFQVLSNKKILPTSRLGLQNLCKHLGIQLKTSIKNLGMDRGLV